MSDITDFIDRHERIVLLFSAGKDSAACLKLLRPHLAHVLVTWVNPGHPYPETVEYMSAIQRSVPHFQMVLGGQREFVARHGHPADLVPFEATPNGRIAHRSTAPMLVPLEVCCRHNLWEPCQRAVREYAATGCIRGDKEADQLRTEIRSGDVHDGVEYFFPLAAWSDEEVFAYLGEDTPPSYRRGLRTSLDCINCTAYIAENPGRLADLHEHYPDAWAEVQPIVHWMRDITREHLTALEAA
jgi:phosphoadenosine phosphosulfate reductase